MSNIKMMEINKFIKAMVLTMAVLSVIINTGSQTSAATMAVNAPSGLRLRESYTTNSEVLGVVPDGTELDIISKVIVGFDEWCKVEYGGSTGYVSAEYLTDGNSEYLTDGNDVDISKDNDGDKNIDKELLGTWVITAYTHTGNVCANGNYPTAGHTVACNTLPFGTQIYIDGVGIRTVEDTDGGAMGNEWCDLFFDTYEECASWGAQYRDVYLVK